MAGPPQDADELPHGWEVHVRVIAKDAPKDLQDQLKLLEGFEKEGKCGNHTAVYFKTDVFALKAMHELNRKYARGTKIIEASRCETKLYIRNLENYTKDVIKNKVNGVPVVSMVKNGTNSYLLEFRNKACAQHVKDMISTDHRTIPFGRLLLKKDPDIVHIDYVIGGDNYTYKGFIDELRDSVGYHSERVDVLARHPDPVQEKYSKTGAHPVLARQQKYQWPSRWIHIKLQVAGEQTSPITLAVRGDNLYVLGFKIKDDGVWYALVGKSSNAMHLLPPQTVYGEPKVLDWGVDHPSLMAVPGVEEVKQELMKDLIKYLIERQGEALVKKNEKALSRFQEDLVITENDRVKKELKEVPLGEDFVKKAVKTLSEFETKDTFSGNDRKNANPRENTYVHRYTRALDRLIVMISESARMNSIYDLVEKFKSYEEGNDKDGERKTKWESECASVMDYIWKWGAISHVLLSCKSLNEDNDWSEAVTKFKKRNDKTNSGFEGPEQALKVVHLVLNWVA